MGALKRWRQLGQGKFRKWQTPGEELEGRWEGQHDGQYGPLGSVQTSGGRVTFPLHANLLRQVAEVPVGKDVRMKYLGKETARKSGREYHAFDVFTLDDDMSMPADVEGSGSEESVGIE